MPHIRFSTLVFAMALLALGTIVAVPQAHAVSAGQPCGGVVEGTCDKGLWCEPAVGKCPSSTQSADQSGTCVTVPKLCIARKRSKNFEPVCGCNSKTYSSDCFRRAYRVGKHHDGKC
jgi:hypothetical protein